MTKGLMICVYGWLGAAADPIGGQKQIRARALAAGWACPGIFEYRDSNGIVSTIDAFHKQHPGLPIVIEGDSCGANVLAQIIAWVAPIKIAYAAFIQPSTYCNFNYPRIKANCTQARIFYSDWVHTAGFGTFIPQPEAQPAQPIVETINKLEWHRVNGGLTLYRAEYVPAFHPDDDDITHVQNPIFADLEGIAHV